MATGDKLKDPTKKSAYAEMMTSRWALADALMGGSEAMRGAGDEFLPRHKNEDDDEYANRLSRSFLLPVFAQSVENLTDTVFSQPMKWSDAIDDDLSDMLEEIDAEGNDIELFAKQMLALAMAKGEVYVICDAPELPKPEVDGAPVSLADVRRTMGGGRPYLALISADNMLDYKVTKRNGRVFCTYARWYETEWIEDVDDFGDFMVERVFEWWIEENAATWKRFERESGTTEWLEDDGVLDIAWEGKPILPISRYRIGGVDSYGRLLPPLNGLAEKNVEHWQSSSDQRAILTVSRFPMLGGSGVDPETLEKDPSGKHVVIGPNVTMFSRDPQSEFYYIEPQGTAIAAGEKDLDRLEKDMSVLAYQPLMRQQAGVTATKDALGQNKANSSLQAWSIALGLALDVAVEFLSIWKRREPPETSFAPNTEFGIDTVDQVRVTALQAMRNGGDLSRPQFIAQMRGEGILDGDFDAEANDAELESEGPAITADPATGLPVQVPGLPNMDPPIPAPASPPPNPRAA